MHWTRRAVPTPHWPMPWNDLGSIERSMNTMTSSTSTGNFEIVSEQVDLPRGAYAKGHRLNIRWQGHSLCALSQGAFRAYLFPVYTPQGYPVTTESPLDHPHHNSVWMALDRVHCALPFAEQDTEEAVYNFYVNETFQGRAPGRIEETEATWSSTAPDHLQVCQQLVWRGPKEWGQESGRIVLKEERRWEFMPAQRFHTIDLYSKLFATEWNLRLGPTRHGYFGVRLAESLRATAGGWMFDAAGREKGKAITGTVSSWVAAGGSKGNGEYAGVILFPHPNAAGHPWFVTDWGTLTVNPFVDQSIPLLVGSSYEIGVRLLIHDGRVSPEQVVAYFQQFQESMGG